MIFSKDLQDSENVKLPKKPLIGMVNFPKKLSFKFGILPLVICIFLYIILLLFQHADQLVYASPTLLFLLNTLFYTISGLAIAIICAKSYLSEGSLSILLLGMATTVGGITASIAGFAAVISVNYNVTIFNLGFLFAGGLQVLSAIITITAALPSPQLHRKASLIIGYSTVTSIALLLSILVIFGFAPVFFTNLGPTVIRQWSLGIATLFFASSSGLFMWQFLQTKSKALYWYSVALAFLALSLYGSLVYITPNGILNWVARFAGYIASFYFAIALIVTNRSFDYENGFPERFPIKWHDAFRSDNRQLDLFFSKIAEAFSYCRILTDETGKPIDWVYLDVNKAFEQSNQKNKKDIIGKRMTEVFPTITRDSNDWANFFGKVAITGVPDKRDCYIEGKGKWFHVSVYSPGNRYFVSIFEDITKRKEIEEKLRESEELYRTVFENSEDGFVLVEPIGIYESIRDFRILKVNAAYKKHTGRESSLIEGKTVLELKGKLEPEYISIGTQVLTTGKSIHQQIYNKFANKWFDCHFFPFVNGRVGILFVDSTERVNLEKQLKDSERLAAIGATAGMVGHDIRNPLQAIMSDTYLLKDELSIMPECKAKESVVESLDSIERNIAYINKIVADLQDFSKQIKPEFTDIDLYQLSINILKSIASEKNLEITLEISPSIRLKSDPTLLTRILTNLVTNAIQAMPNGGKLLVGAYSKADKMVIEVTDTGVGIAEDVKPKVFSPMMTTKSKGQGLGLAVVKKLVEALNGNIRFESEQGKGTKFIIELPT